MNKNKNLTKIEDEDIDPKKVEKVSHDTSNLEVLPLREENDDKVIRKKIHPNLPQPNFLLVTIGATGTGKTVATANLLLNKYMYGGKPHAFARVYIFSPSIFLDDSSKYLVDNFTCFPEYTDEILGNILESQEEFTKDEMPNICIVLDDSIGTKAMNRSSKISYFLSRYRHWNCSVMINSQHFRSVVSLARANATDAIIFQIPNEKELSKVEEEWGGMYENQFLSLYRQATSERFNFLYLKLRKIPAEAYHNFTSQLNYSSKKKIADNNITLEENIEQ